MADQDFNIKVVTTADTTGIRQTEQALGGLQKTAQSFAGLTGISLGLGTLISLLTTAAGKFKELSDEQAQWIENAVKTEQKMRELGEAIVEMQDKAISARRTATEPLQQSFIRLQQEIIRLKTEQNLLNLPEQGEEWKKLNQQIADAENQLKKVQSALQQQAAKGGPQTALPIVPGPVAGKGESQALVDQIEANRRAFEEQQKENVWEFDPETGGYRLSGQKQFPLFQPAPTPLTNPRTNENMIPSRVGDNQPLTLDLIRQAFEQAMLKYWGP